MNEQTECGNCTEPAVLTKEDEALLALRNELPEYVVQSFMAAGYDTLQVIAKMDTSRNPGNSLEEIEQFISCEFKGDHRFERGITSKSNFKFLPGHRQRIIDFVSKIRLNEDKKDKQFKNKRLANKSSVKDYTLKAKRKKINCGLDDDSEVLDQAKAATMVRQQLNKWQRAHSSLNIRELKESEDFDIQISLSKDNSDLRVSVLCNICSSSTTLGFKGDTILLSNWTRHITKCAEKRKPSTSKVNKIQDFFSPKASHNNTLPLKASVVSSGPETSTEAIPDNTPPSHLLSQESESPVNKEDSLNTSSVQSSAIQKQSHNFNQVFRKSPPAHI